MSKEAQSTKSQQTAQRKGKRKKAAGNYLNAYRNSLLVYPTSASRHYRVAQWENSAATSSRARELFRRRGRKRPSAPGGCSLSRAAIWTRGPSRAPPASPRRTVITISRPRLQGLVLFSSRLGVDPRPPRDRRLCLTGRAASPAVSSFRITERFASPARYRDRPIRGPSGLSKCDGATEKRFLEIRWPRLIYRFGG